MILGCFLVQIWVFFGIRSMKKVCQNVCRSESANMLIWSRRAGPTACSEVSKSIKNLLTFSKRIEKDIARSWVAKNSDFGVILAQKLCQNGSQKAQKVKRKSMQNFECEKRASDAHRTVQGLCKHCWVGAMLTPYS